MAKYTQKGKKRERGEEGREKVENRGRGGCEIYRNRKWRPLNAAFRGTAGGFSEENGVNSPDREVLIARTVLGETECRLRHLRMPYSEDCSYIADTCFNDGDLCSFNCAHRCKSYLWLIYPHMPK